MNIFWKTLPLIIILLTGCSTAKVLMQVDTALEANSIVYKLDYPDSVSDKVSGKRLNVSFGPYRVTNADVSWTRTDTKAEDPEPVFGSSSTHKSGDTTITKEIRGGPTSILGYTRPADEGEPSIKKTSRTISYKFKVGHDITWKAHCSHKAKKRVTEFETSNAIETLSSKFTCQYTMNAGDESNNDVWILSVDYDGTITMTQKGKPNTLVAHSTGGMLVKSDGLPTNISTVSAGYSWSQIIDGNEKNIAAISVREETPRVWLDKGNSDSLNHILSMASTGLLIYSWEIQQ
jgi:hypothetical protein